LWLEERDNLQPGEDLVIRSVPDKQYVDLGMSFEFSDHLAARFGVNNVFDAEPGITTPTPGCTTFSGAAISCR
jgi:outer membrane receptor protein involved in Fe transport